MPKTDGYFQEAISLSDSPDPTVSRIASTLYQQTCCAFVEDQYNPGHCFNWVYFFQTVAKACFARSELEYPVNRLPAGTICGCNWPSSEPVLPLVRHFMEMVAADSVAEGDPFDVDYAVRMIERSLDSTGHFLVPTPTQVPEIGYDEWLAAFNSPEPQ